MWGCAPRPLSLGKHSGGYQSVGLYDGRGAERRCLVHRMVAEAFLGPVEGRVVNHKNRKRDDNRAENLEIVSQHENLAHYLADDDLKRRTAGMSDALLYL